MIFLSAAVLKSITSIKAILLMERQTKIFTFAQSGYIWFTGSYSARYRINFFNCPYAQPDYGYGNIYMAQRYKRCYLEQQPTGSI
jgi:hypothetical protein